MSRYANLMTEVLDAIFEGYNLSDGKLKVVNEQAAKRAQEKLHSLVLEKSRDLWDQLEAAEDSLADVAEEISFEELNMDPASVATSHEEDADAVDQPPQGAEEATLESLLGSEDFNLDEIFEQSKKKVREHGMDHLDGEEADMPFDETMGDGGDVNRGEQPPRMSYEQEGEDYENNDNDYEDMENMDMGDMDMGDMDMDMGDMDMDYDENGEEENGEEDGFDFDLDLEGEDEEYGAPEGEEEYEVPPEGEEENGEEENGEEEYEEAVGGDKSYKYEKYGKHDYDKDGDYDEKAKEGY